MRGQFWCKFRFCKVWVMRGNGLREVWVKRGSTVPKRDFVNYIRRHLFNFLRHTSVLTRPWSF